jgi:hypothetical protein
MPFADHGGLVAGLLQLFAHVITRRARLGVQIELVQKQLVIRTPPAAMRSILGVPLIRLPYAEIA